MQNYSIESFTTFDYFFLPPANILVVLSFVLHQIIRNVEKNPWTFYAISIILIPIPVSSPFFLEMPI